MSAFDLQPQANSDLVEVADTEIERFGIVVVLGLSLLTALMLSALLYLYHGYP